MRARDTIDIYYTGDRYTFRCERPSRTEHRQFEQAEQAALTRFQAATASARATIGPGNDVSKLTPELQRTITEAGRERLEAQYDTCLEMLATHCTRIEHTPGSGEHALTGYPEGPMSAGTPARLAARLEWLENAIPENMVRRVVQQMVELRIGVEADMGKFPGSPEPSRAPAPQTSEAPNDAGSAQTS